MYCTACMDFRVKSMNWMSHMVCWTLHICTLSLERRKLKAHTAALLLHRVGAARWVITTSHYGARLTHRIDWHVHLKRTDGSWRVMCVTRAPPTVQAHCCSCVLCTTLVLWSISAKQNFLHTQNKASRSLTNSNTKKMTVTEKGRVGSFPVYSNYDKNGAEPG